MAGRFEDDPVGLMILRPDDQFRDAGFVVGETAAFAQRPDERVQVILANIDPDIRETHKGTLPGNKRFGTTGVTCSRW